MPSDDSPIKEESSSPSRGGGEGEGSPEEEASEDERVGPLLAVGIFTALGFELAAFVFVGLYVGHWVDKQVGSSPAFMLVFVILACVAAGWHVYRIAERYL
jgi:F0F1-type ATP synthase assembly protein I